MKTTRVLFLGLGLVFMAGCAAFETNPADVHHKLTHPLNGHLYVPEAARDRQTAWWSEGSPR